MQQFKLSIDRIPEMYIHKEVKTKLVKCRENINFRTVQAKIAQKTYDDWTIKNLIKQVNDDRKERIQKLKQQSRFAVEQ